MTDPLTEYEILRIIETNSVRSRERTIAVLLEAGRPDLVEELKYRAIDNGTDGARATWHSISQAQRDALAFAERAGGRLIWWGETSVSLLRPRKRYICDPGRLMAPPRPILRPTVRNLCARELMAWDGGIPDPEMAAVVTERGRFVLRHGPMER